MPEREVDFLIVGGGDAGLLRRPHAARGGRGGRVVIVSRDPDPPYDRTAVSKGYLGGDEARDETLLGDDGLVRRARRRAAHAHERDEARPRGAHGQLANKDVITYGKLLLATGANVRRLRIDGCDLDGIHYLRALGNADSIRADTENAEHVVLVGGSYIATEVAATLTALGRKCAIVMQEEVTLERTLRQDRRRLLPEGADRPRRRGPRRRGRRALRGRRRPRHRRRHQERHRASRPTR